jgi:hypothetical protein
VPELQERDSHRMTVHITRCSSCRRAVASTSASCGPAPDASSCLPCARCCWSRPCPLQGPTRKRLAWWKRLRRRSCHGPQSRLGKRVPPVGVQVAPAAAGRVINSYEPSVTRPCTSVACAGSVSYVWPRRSGVMWWRGRRPSSTAL